MTYVEDLEYATNCLIETTVRKAMAFPDELNAIPGAEAVFQTDMAFREFLIEETDRIIGPWRQLTDPESFTSAISHLEEARSFISNTPVRELTDISPSFLGGPLIPSMVDNIHTNLEGWQGKTIDAVRKNYLSRFHSMMNLQTNTLTVLILTTEAFRDSYREAQKDIIATINTAEEAIDILDFWGGDSTKNASFNIAAGVVAAFSGASGPFTAVITALATAGFSQLKDSINTTDPKDIPLGASTINGVWANFEDAVLKLRDHLGDVQRELAEIVRGFYNSLDDDVRIKPGDNIEEGLRITATDLIRLPQLPVTTSVERPDSSYRPPPPVHRPDFECEAD